ncbi:hypothetical protein A9G13_07855 [Gilliamella sp. wkB178]|uniref:DUF2975 domain-containing protein n=1 Tax=Gilliamella sp. wkB178 TaxID=3120259 RepID=UPI00080DD65B|nr:DUF2975 domain-containing protein [Gilliamella apicola]OCG06896.1 hypothetical protein A9G13_07855 [Gilliamella apicola]
MNTDLTQKYSRLNLYCKFMALLTIIPILSTLIGALSPLLFYFFDTTNIGLDSGGYSFFISNGISEVDPKSLSLWQATLATLIDTLLILILSYAFYQLRLLFLNYSQSEYFSEKSASHCYTFGKMLVIWSIFGILSEPVLTLILTFNNDPSERYISFSFTSEDIMTLFPAISIMLIGQILKKACQIAEEN